MKQIFTIIFLVFSLASYAQIDLGFGANGHATLDIGGNNNYPNFMRPTLDNGFIVSDYDMNSGSAFLVKFNANGKVDSSFAGGMFEYLFPNGTFGGFYEIIQQADSSYLVFGNYGDAVNIIVNLVIRIDKDGVLDASYNVDGKITHNLSPLLAGGKVSMLDSDGKILIAGFYETGFGQNEMFISRYNSAGFVDNTFGINGVRTMNVYSSASFLPKVLFRSDPQHYMIVGWMYNNGNEILFVRFNNDGKVDSSYGVNGVKSLSGFDYVGLTGVKVRGASCYLFGTSTSPQTLKGKSYVLKTNYDAQVDINFGTGGIDTNLLLSSHDHHASGLEIDPNGNYFISGTVFEDTAKFFLVKKNSQLLHSSSFGNNGVFITKSDSSINDFAGFSCLLSDQSWIVGGHYYPFKQNSNGSSDMTFCKVGPVYPSGIDEIQTVEILLWPNPCKDILTVKEFEHDATLSIYTLNGQKVNEWHLSKKGSQIDVSRLDVGFYFVRIETSGVSYYTRLLKRE